MVWLTLLPGPSERCAPSDPSLYYATSVPTLCRFLVNFYMQKLQILFVPIFQALRRLYNSCISKAFGRFILFCIFNIPCKKHKSDTILNRFV